MMNRSGSRAERGQSMVELAISLLFFIMLLVAIADFGRAFFVYLQLRDAAQEGAIYGSICPTNTSKIESHARQASTVPINLADTGSVSISTSFPDGSTTPGYRVRVNVTYNSYQITTPFVGSFVGGQTITLNGWAEDTILRNDAPCP